VDKNRVSSTAAATSPVSSQCSTSIPAAVPADSTPLKAAFSHPKLTGPVLKHIPRSARPACCSALTAILNGIVQSPFNDYSAWNKLMNFATDVLLNPPRTGGQSNIAKCIKDRIAGTSSAAKTCSSAMQKTRNFDLARAVTSKVEEGNIRAAIRLTCSEDKPAAFSGAVLAAMQSKHPPASTSTVSVPEPSSFSSFQVTENDVLRAVKAFPAGSSGGPDGFSPKHLLELVTCQSNGRTLLTALTGFVNHVLDGKCPNSVRPVFFGARLLALEKKNGEYRPIAVGYTLRRLAAKCANSFAQKKLSDYFCPVQVGVAVSGVCEAAVHATRRFLESMPPDEVIVKLDFSNAFNTIRRDAVLNAVSGKLPELYRFCHAAYGDTSLLQFGEESISSAEGVQQGDPLGPLLFCLTLQPILSSLSSKLRLGYLDDVTLGGSFNAVNLDVELIESSGQSLGLILNRTKCEIISHSPIAPGFSVSEFCSVSPAESSLLGAPLLVGTALDKALQKSYSELSVAEGRLTSIAAHDALVLLKSSLSTPRILHLLRSTPCTGHKSLQTIDNLLRRCTGKITNCSLSDSQWLQASLPVKAGGLGIRLACHLAPSAYLAAGYATKELQERILSVTSLPLSSHESSVFATWSTLTQASPPLGLSASKQSNWDSCIVDSALESLLTNDQDRARLLAVSANHSSDWLHALPISSCGLRMSDEDIRVAVGLRLGTSICQPHQCPCGTDVDSTGIHALSCKKSSSRILRHNALNDLIFRALVKAGVPSAKEPPGLLRSDGRRPDGVTQIPWASGKCLAWDVTVTSTLAPSYSHLSSISAGKAAERAAEMKVGKYSAITMTHDFLPIAFETLGPLNSAAAEFLTSLGKRLTCSTGDSRECSFLFQRLSVALQRFNSIAVSDSFVLTNAEDHL